MSFENNENTVIQNINSGNPYTRLGIDEMNSTPQDIKAAYLQLETKYNGDEDKLRLLEEAYSEISGDRESRIKNPVSSHSENSSQEGESSHDFIDNKKIEMAAALEKMKAQMKQKE